MSNATIIILSSARTLIGGLQNEIASLAALQRSGHALRAAVECIGIAAEAIEEVVLGCVLPAGLCQAPVRQATIEAV